LIPLPWHEDLPQRSGRAEAASGTGAIEELNWELLLSLGLWFLSFEF
jgi:hypothetical protein